MSASPPTVLLFGGTLLALDGTFRTLDDAEILLSGGRVAAVGRALTALPGTNFLDITGCLVLPGLVLPHAPLSRTLFHSAADGDALEAAHDDDSAHVAALTGGVACLLRGITTVRDLGTVAGIDGHLAGLHESGIHAYTGPVFADADDLPSGLRTDADDVAGSLERFDQALARLGDATLIHPLLQLRHADRASAALCQRVAEAADARHQQLHAQLTAAADDQAVRQRLAALDAGSLTFGHEQPAARPDDLPQLAEPLAYAHAAVRAAKADPSGRDVLAEATRQGVAGLGLQSEAGTVEVGRRADLVIVRRSDPSLWTDEPVDLHDAVAHGLSRADVRHVFVAGHHRVNEGKLANVDQAALRERAQHALAAVRERRAAQ
ncbi:MAG: hypothetical protein AAF772_14845 [Acidobacteriota bacterium]